MSIPVFVHEVQSCTNANQVMLMRSVKRMCA